VLFLLRPRQTRVPYALPRDPDQVAWHNEEAQRAYRDTRRTAAPEPSAPDPVTALRDLADLHRSGALTDAEFQAAKSKVLSDPSAP
jgi:Short C-terminal domain